ncbi:hypothetical protein FHX49_000658 [Microbacterium endophyticum]|uniref:Uncharacterized protein n=1 Tax=Microbacterium endophyticum TaxID=1526412 RepID=A0A7W4V1I7_9MICO|nr:hypothetical protein [Microbacterium endophyticum]MBB2975117.1 hypothetical protein [Microbacterium endophyticum]NIK37343.1 hypothetical protein [Microbacterium endophyticum]
MTARVAFSLSIPPSWSEIDLRPLTRDRAIAQIVQDRYSKVPELRPHRAEMVSYLRDTARSAWDIGCRYCGVFLEAADDGIVPGSVTVSILPPAPETGGQPLEDIVSQLTGIEATHNDQYWLRTTTTELTHAGPAARTYGIQPIHLNNRRITAPAVLMNTFVPFPGGVALISAGSPAAEIHEPLLELFDAVTDTFRLHPLPGENQ